MFDTLALLTRGRENSQNTSHGHRKNDYYKDTQIHKYKDYFFLVFWSENIKILLFIKIFNSFNYILTKIKEELPNGRWRLRVPNDHIRKSSVVVVICFHLDKNYHSSSKRYQTRFEQE